MKILITGGFGDIGIELVRELKRVGHNVIVFDLTTRLEKLNDTDNINIVKGNVLNLEDLLHAVTDNGKVDCIVHLAAMLPDDCESRPLEGMKVNVIGAANVMEACRIAGVRRLVYGSSSAIYGYGSMSTSDNIDEDYPKNPNGLYSISKYTAEKYLTYCSIKYGIVYSALRIRILAGSGQRLDTGLWRTLPLSRIVNELLTKKKSVFSIDPETKIELTHPVDAARALALMCSKSKLDSKSYNLMSAVCTVREIAKILESHIPGSKVIFPPLNLERTIIEDPLKFGNFDISRAINELGYSPQYSAHSILEECIDYELVQQKNKL
jgi:nucleoside-diphosphate-sugar epimerase